MSVSGSVKKPTTRTAGSAKRNTLRHVVPAYTPATATNRRENKPLDSGARVEHGTMVALNREGINLWRNPGIRLERSSGKGLVPDYGMDLDVVTARLGKRMADVIGRPEYSVIGSMKAQHVTGSAEHKLDAEIVDMAIAADEARSVPFVLIDSSVYTLGQLESWRVLGEQHMVVVMPVEDMGGGRLVQALDQMAKRRARLYRRLNRNGNVPPRKGSYRYTRDEIRYLDRRARIKAARTVLAASTA